MKKSESVNRKTEPQFRINRIRGSRSNLSLIRGPLTKKVGQGGLKGDTRLAAFMSYISLLYLVLQTNENILGGRGDFWISLISNSIRLDRIFLPLLPHADWPHLCRVRISPRSGVRKHHSGLNSDHSRTQPIRVALLVTICFFTREASSIRLNRLNLVNTKNASRRSRVLGQL